MFDIQNACRLLAFIFSLCLVSIFLFLKRTLTSPLNAIPGPWSARFSDFIYFYHSAIRQRQAQYVDPLHQKYGPIVRISPNQIGIASLEGVRAIRKISSGFAKSSWYDYIAMTEANRGPPGLFQMRDFHDHATRRKLLARGFTVSSLRKDWEEMVREKASKAVMTISNDADAGGVVDIRKWWLIMASDVVSEVVFGRSFGGLETGKNSTFSSAILRANRINMLALQAPWLYQMAKHIPVPAWRPHLAMMEVRIATTLFFREFKGAKLAADTTEKSMAMDNFVILHPASGVCKIVLPKMN